MATIFFFAGKKPYSLAVYIGFGFMWLSVIFCMCLNYLISFNAPDTLELVNMGYAVFFCAVFFCSVVFPDALGLYNLIFVDFLLFCAMALYVVVIRRLPKRGKKD